MVSGIRWEGLRFLLKGLGLELLSCLRCGDEGPSFHVWKIHLHLWRIKALGLVSAAH